MNLIFETERLLIRKLTPKDFESYHKLFTDNQVIKYLSSVFFTKNEICSEFKEIIKNGSLENGKIRIYGLERKKDAAFIGSCYTWNHPNLSIEIGYVFFSSFWNNGYGSEYLKGKIDFLKALDCKNIIAKIDSRNIASIRMVEKLQFIPIASILNEFENCLEIEYQLLI
ncbi:GNAT family N-acetyltransferase [Aureivirga sp. CE67]|uniref:GNAT family N-acetyltransferase n=1 Tax=Aureivirga sp. CE67 TaxID=1788983 RepID=UPI0018C91743|nr:GNAT family N-acetyltransferase [Aureivirga sp. CE67]